MKSNINWGAGILIVIILFFGTIVFRLIIAYKQKTELVEPDYYVNQLQHQQMINKKINAANLGQQIQFRINENNLVIKYPDTFNHFILSGIIKLYRPSNNKYDQTINIKTDSNGYQVIDLSQLPIGKYILSFDYKLNKIPFYQETEIQYNVRY